MHTVVAAALVRDGQVLLGHRAPTRRWYPDVWDVLGGHVDEDESPQEALVRELDEEIGVAVDLDLGTPLAHIVDPTGQGGGLDITIWVVTLWRGEVANRAPDEHDELRWFTRDELPRLRMAHSRLPALLERILSDGSV